MAFPIIFNKAKGRDVGYADLPLTNDGFYWIWLKASGLESDATLQDYDDMAALLAASNDEATTVGRVAAVSVTVTTDDTNNWQLIDVTTDATATPSGIENLGAVVLAYDPDTTGGSDSTLVPVFADAFVVTTANGVPITYTLPTGGIIKAA